MRAVIIFLTCAAIAAAVQPAPRAIAPKPLQRAVVGRRVCRANNCLRAVVGTHRGPLATAQAKLDCSSYVGATDDQRTSGIVIVTETLDDSTETVTSTTTASVATGIFALDLKATTSTDSLSDPVTSTADSTDLKASSTDFTGLTTSTEITTIPTTSMDPVDPTTSTTDTSDPFTVTIETSDPTTVTTDTSDPITVTEVVSTDTTPIATPDPTTTTQGRVNSGIPAYASKCQPAAYVSACSCFGITGGDGGRSTAVISTTTVSGGTVTTTDIATETATATSTATPESFKLRIDADGSYAVVLPIGGEDDQFYMSGGADSDGASTCALGAANELVCDELVVVKVLVDADRPLFAGGKAFLTDYADEIAPLACSVFKGQLQCGGGSFYYSAVYGVFSGQPSYADAVAVTLDPEFQP